MKKEFNLSEIMKRRNLSWSYIEQLEKGIKQFIKEILDEIEKKQKVLGEHRPINWEGFWNELEGLKQTIKNQEIN